MSYLNSVRVVQPQVVEPQRQSASGGVEDPHDALLETEGTVRRDIEGIVSGILQ